MNTETTTEFKCEVCHCGIRFNDPQPIGMNAVRCSRHRSDNPDPKRARANYLRRQMARLRGTPGGTYGE